MANILRKLKRKTIAVIVGAVCILVAIAILITSIVLLKDKAKDVVADLSSDTTTSNTVSVTIPDITGVDDSDNKDDLSSDGGLVIDVGGEVPSEDEVSEIPTIKPTSISLNKVSITLLKGESFTINTTFTPSNTSQIHKGLSFKTSNSKVATVSESGTVKANAKGSCRITVSCADVPTISKQLNITVYERENNDNSKDTSSTVKPPVNDNGNNSKPKYDCGNPKHHCLNEYAHKSLVEREKEGCPYCDSHSCPSFYGVNEWGTNKYDATLCPKYNVKNDPAVTCQDCGRKIGIKAGECMQLLIDGECDICGKWVKGRTCHYHD